MKSVIKISFLLICLYLNVESKAQHSLDMKQISIIRIASSTGNGNLKVLKGAINEGLDVGLTINEIKEILIHTYAYAGFPRSIQGLQTFMNVLDERKRKNIKDEEGTNASVIVSDSSKYERGKATLEKLTGIVEENSKKGYASFAPTIELFLKEHLFADIFERDILNYQERELATISVLCSIGGVEPMLSAHLRICLHIGYSMYQLKEFYKIIKKNMRKKEIKSLRKILNK